MFKSKNFVYTDGCSEASKKVILNSLGLRVIVREDTLWDLGYISSLITNPSLSIVVLRAIDERSIAEITMAAFMCKPILITTDSIKEYTHIYPFVSDVEAGADLDTDNNTFIHWYTYAIGR
jgi:hypothetical protein